MEDKKLIELAAKAAGISLAWCREAYGHRDNPDVREGWRIVRTDPLGLGLFGAWWNPLTDDGDAFRLAVKFHLLIGTHAEESWAQFYEATGTGWRTFKEPNLEDECAALRRAIVRAVAKICLSLFRPSKSTID